MDEHRASILVNAVAERILRVATDPALAPEWFPLPLELAGHAGRHLRPGECCRAEGSLAGRRIEATVTLHAADRERFRLSAHGPLNVEIDVRLLEELGVCTLVAHVRCTPGRGLAGRLLHAAAKPLLRPGAERGLKRIKALAEA